MERIYLVGDILSNQMVEDFFSESGTVSTDEIQMQLDRIDDDIEVLVNTYGGIATAGLHMGDVFAAWKLAHPNRKMEALIIGNCMSAGVGAIMPFDTIRAYPSAQIMIHPAWTITIGNSKDHRDAADRLDSTDEMIKSHYKLWRNLDVDSDPELKSLYENETVISAARAAELGIIDAVYDLKAQQNASVFDLNKAFNYLNSSKRMDLIKEIKNLLVKHEVKNDASEAQQTQEVEQKQDDQKQEVDPLEARIAELENSLKERDEKIALLESEKEAVVVENSKKLEAEQAEKAKYKAFHDEVKDFYDEAIQAKNQKDLPSINSKKNDAKPGSYQDYRNKVAARAK